MMRDGHQDPGNTPGEHFSPPRSTHLRNMAYLQSILSGASRDRTGDLLLAKQALSQLSYGPWSPQYTHYCAVSAFSLSAIVAVGNAFGSPLSDRCPSIVLDASAT